MKRMKAKSMKGFILYYVIKINENIKNVIFMGNFLICYQTHFGALSDEKFFPESHRSIIYIYFGN